MTDAPAKRLRFGIGLRGGATRDLYLDKVRRAEDQGYDVVNLSDHLIGDNLGLVAGLAAAAGASEHLRLVALVANNEFRHPVILAKEMASVDLVSEGRLELGMGAGWWQLEHDQAGIPFERPKVRIARLAEAVQVVKGAWTQPNFSFSGEHYRIDDLTLGPVPVQQPHPPLAIGGGGKLVLSLAARQADIVHVTMRTVADGADPTDSGRQAFLDKLALIRRVAGDRFGDIELAVTIGIVAPDEASVAGGRHPSALAQLEQARDTPQVLLGSTDAICDEVLHWHTEHGISQFSVMNDVDAEVFAPVVARLSQR
ncbi:MAG TPA: TIGR03621 family F420-dependent LLM class oxidoreductase [Acidimicrobiales bacterium]|nr:TIGR03621 family F420-dependent LLM class oxidoreductase [Acidimicrobiales bacterium]